MKRLLHIWLLTAALTLPLAAQESQAPPGVANMRRITGKTTPAHKAIEKFRKGANLGNYLEAPPNQNWGATYSAADFINIKKEGFDHVRIPIAWHHYAASSPPFDLSKSIFFINIIT